MNGFELVAGVIAVFFAAGIAVGVLLVIAIPTFGRRQRGRGYLNGGGWQEPPALRDGDPKPPRWPGR